MWTFLDTMTRVFVQEYTTQVQGVQLTSHPSSRPLSEQYRLPASGNVHVAFDSATAPAPYVVVVRV
jgi:hypothetical protein